MSATLERKSTFEVTPVECDYTTYYLRKAPKPLNRALDALADQTKRTGEIRVGTALAFFCSECGAKLNATFPENGDYGSIGDSFDALEENRLIVMVDPCPNCHADSEDEIGDDESDGEDWKRADVTPDYFTSSEGRA